MTIQKKSLISSLNTTKKAIVASSPLEAPTASEKPGVKLGTVGRNAKLGTVGHQAKLGTVGHQARLGTVGHQAKLAKFAKLGKI